MNTKLHFLVPAALAAGLAVTPALSSQDVPLVTASERSCAELAAVATANHPYLRATTIDAVERVLARGEPMECATLARRTAAAGTGR